MSKNEYSSFDICSRATPEDTVYSELAMRALHWLTLLYTKQRHLKSMASAPEIVMTVKEVADYLRVNQRTVYRLAVERKIPGFKVGATWRFRRTDIDGWIAAQAACPVGDVPAGRKRAQ